MEQITRNQSGPLVVGSTALVFTMTGPMAWLGALLAGRRVRQYADMGVAGLAQAAEAAR